MKHILLTKSSTGWNIEWLTDPEREETYQLFGVYAIPLPYTATAEEDVVIQLIKKASPGAIITVPGY